MKNENKKRIILLDMFAILHRAYHAIPDFTTSAGKPTGALYGLVSMIIATVKELNPDFIIACYDMPGGTFRGTLHDGYKAHRPKTEESLSEQINESYEILEALAIPFYQKEGYEADDILGTLAEILKKEKDNEVVIVSGDMDTLQLVDGEKVKVFTLKRGLSDTILYDEKAVVARFGFSPKLIPDYKGLRGDPSDNIPGIAGIGEKTAGILISKFGGLSEIYKKLKTKKQEFLDAGLKERIVKLLEEGEEEAEFSKTLAQIVCNIDLDFALPKKTWRESINVSHAQKSLINLEFRSLVSRLQTLFGESSPKEEEVREEIEMTKEDRVKLSIAVWLLDSEKTNPDEEDILNFAKTQNVDDAKKYIWNELQKNKLEKVYKEIEEPLISIIDEMEKNGIKIDKKYFKKLSNEYHQELEKIEKEIYKFSGTEFNIKSPKQLSNILFEVLKLPTTGVKKSAGGAYSTDIRILEKLEDSHEIIKKIIEYRELQKLLSTYIDVIPEMAGEDGRLHPQFLQTGSSTGRFSSNNPNIQNIPTKSELGRRVRGGFVAEEGFKFASFDYSQIEFRLAAIFSQDEYLIQTFQNGVDVHSAVAAKVFDVSPENVTKEMRRRAKVINFGILYGMGINALKKNLGSTQKEASEFYEEYFRKFKRISDYLEDTKNFARANGYTETLFGRRRYFKNINSKITFIQKTAERTATNAPLQGTAADIIKLAMRFVCERLKKENMENDVKLLLQIHDELIFEIKDDALEKAIPIIKEEMESVFENSFIHYKSEVPLIVNNSNGSTWQEL